MHIDLLTKILLIALATNAITRVGCKLVDPLILKLLNGGPIRRLIPLSLLLGRLLSCQLCVSAWVGMFLGLLLAQYSLADIPAHLYTPLTIAAIVGLADAIRRRD